jgi:hypothetical protein
MNLSSGDVALLCVGLQQRAESLRDRAREAAEEKRTIDYAKCHAGAAAILSVIREIEGCCFRARQSFAAGPGPTIARALASAIADLAWRKRIPDNELAKALSDFTACEQFQLGERDPTLTEVFQLAAALQITPEALVAAASMRLEFFGNAGRAVLLTYVGASRVYVLPDGKWWRDHGEAFRHYGDAFRRAKQLNREAEKAEVPPMTHISVFGLIAEVPL